MVMVAVLGMPALSRGRLRAFGRARAAPGSSPEVARRARGARKTLQDEGAAQGPISRRRREGTAPRQRARAQAGRGCGAYWTMPEHYAGRAGGGKEFQPARQAHRPKFFARPITCLGREKPPAGSRRSSWRPSCGCCGACGSSWGSWWPCWSQSRPGAPSCRRVQQEPPARQGPREQQPGPGFGRELARRPGAATSAADRIGSFIGSPWGITRVERACASARCP